MARKPQENPALDMTPMIDVVFELIIFFVVTIKQEDIFSKLNANRPAPSSGPSQGSDDTSIEIDVGAGRTLNGVILYKKREIKLDELDKNLKEIARTSTKTPVIIRCAEDSPHKAVAQVMNACTENGIWKISFMAVQEDKTSKPGHPGRKRLSRLKGRSR